MRSGAAAPIDSVVPATAIVPPKPHDAARIRPSRSTRSDPADESLPAQRSPRYDAVLSKYYAAKQRGNLARIRLLRKAIDQLRPTLARPYQIASSGSCTARRATRTSRAEDEYSGISRLHQRHGTNEELGTRRPGARGWPYAESCVLVWTRAASAIS
jgi:hypothetical protein